MFFLILHIFLLGSFSLIIKYYQASGRNLLAVGAVNYAIAAFVAALSVIYKGDFEFSNATWFIGILGGIAYSISYFFLINAVKLSGISITWSVVRLSVLVPVLVSIFYWKEQPNSYQIVGIGFACLSLPLLSINFRNAGANPQKIGRAGALIIALFIAAGGSNLAFKAFNEFSVGSQQRMYLLFLFSTAAIISASALLIKKSLPKAIDIPFGIALGLSNISAGYYLLLALMRLPGMVAFPISGSMGIVLTTLAGMIIWRESLRRITILGIIAAVIAVVLINLK
jgi:drug/metabolite transporter (DMT)-like permease